MPGVIGSTEFPGDGSRFLFISAKHQELGPQKSCNLTLASQITLCVGNFGWHQSILPL